MNHEHFVIGLSITSSWGNGHATTYRSLLREMHRNGHDILFLEQDFPWYKQHRDMPYPDFCRTEIYQDPGELYEKYTEEIKNADLVIVGSYVFQGVEVGNFVCDTAQGIKAFYDIDTPVTLARLEKKDYLYLSPKLIPRYDMYLSFTGGPTLKYLEEFYGSPAARALYCSFDPELYYPENREKKWELGYLGTYSDDRQPSLNRLMLQTAENLKRKNFVIAGSMYPKEIEWPQNVQRLEHVAPHEHRSFYNAQKFTLNITRSDMIKSGYSPSVRLFEAAACGVPLISDYWPGMEEFFIPGKEIFIAQTTDRVLHYLQEISEEESLEAAYLARKKVLQDHTAAHRAKELETYVMEMKGITV